MAKNSKRRQKPARQDWHPHWILRLLYSAWMVTFSVLKIALGAIATVALIVGVCMVVFAGTLGDYLEDEVIPSAVMDLEGLDLDQNSYIYYTDHNGQIQLLQNIYAVNNAEWVEYKDIPEHMIHAVIAIEDQRFFEHQGVDWFTTIKACFFMFFGNGDRGGSTITQQLVKNVTGNDAITVQRKVAEIFKATDLERRYDKTVILEEYLNRIYLGQRCTGVKTAAAKYFGKEVEKLTIAECAALISITNNPSLYDPYRPAFEVDGELMTGPQRNRKRQMDVLEEMRDQGWITEAEYAAAVGQEMIFKDGIDEQDRLVTCTVETLDDGTVTGCGYRDTVSMLEIGDDGKKYCPECGKEISAAEDASQYVYSWFVETVLEDVARDLAEQHGDEWNDDTEKLYKDIISRSGYHIYTTIDMDVQAQVDAIYTDLSKIPTTRSGQQLQSGIVIINNETGDIAALCGGVGEKDTFDAYNRAANARLQTGSSIKPLTVYAPAFEAGAISPASVIKDLPIQYNGSTGWPKNDNRKYSYSRTIFTAVRDSVNAVAANTLEMIGEGYSYEFGKELFGLSGLTDSYVSPSGEIKSDIGAAPLAMGAQTLGITVRDMANAYSTFANDGIYREARTYTRVLDSDGNIVLDNTQENEKILSQKTVDYMNYCLLEAVLRGTGTAADFTGHYIYGKTGSTSSNKDRWFCGFTGYYTAAVWCGYDQPEVIELTGSNKQNPAARLFKMVMEPIHEGLDRMSLIRTNKFEEAIICLDCGLLATDACSKDVRTFDEASRDGFSRVEKVKAYKEDLPTEECTCHVMVQYCTEGCAVANEYCHLFAAELTPEGEEQKLIVEAGLVKLTQAQVDELVKNKRNGLWPEFLSDSYVYLIKKDGTDAAFRGMNKDKNKDVNAPYVVCSVHTQAAWEAYLASKVPVEPEPGPGEELPTDPTDPEFPGGLEPVG